MAIFQLDDGAEVGVLLSSTLRYEPYRDGILREGIIDQFNSKIH